MRESTVIMLWMLVFLLLITFWVDVRLKSLREECMGHYIILERLLAGTRAIPHSLQSSGNIRMDTDSRPWFSENPALFDYAGHASSNGGTNAGTTALPDFIDDLVPTKDELSKALRGVGSFCPTEQDSSQQDRASTEWTYPGKTPPIISGMSGQHLEGYDDSQLYAPAWK